MHSPALQSLPADGAEPYRLKVRVAEDYSRKLYCRSPSARPSRSQEERSRAKKKRGARHREQQKVAETAALSDVDTRRIRTDCVRTSEVRGKRQREQDEHSETSDNSDFESSCSSDQCTDLDKGDKANADKAEARRPKKASLIGNSPRSAVETLLPKKRRTHKDHPYRRKRTAIEVSRQTTDSTRTIDRAAKPEAGRTQIQSHTASRVNTCRRSSWLQWLCLLSSRQCRSSVHS